MGFGEDHFNGAAGAGVFACLAFIMVIQPFRKAFGDDGIQRFVVAF